MYLYYLNYLILAVLAREGLICHTHSLSSSFIQVCNEREFCGGPDKKSIGPENERGGSRASENSFTTLFKLFWELSNLVVTYHTDDDHTKMISLK